MMLQQLNQEWRAGRLG